MGVFVCVRARWRDHLSALWTSSSVFGTFLCAQAAGKAQGRSTQSVALLVHCRKVMLWLVSVYVLCVENALPVNGITGYSSIFAE